MPGKPIPFSPTSPPLPDCAASVSVEEHRSLGGSIISRLDNGAFVGLIYKLLVFS